MGKYNNLLTDDPEKEYSMLNVSLNGEKFFVEYLYTLEPLEIEIITVDYVNHHEVEDHELKLEVIEKAEQLIINRINRRKMYVY